MVLVTLIFKETYKMNFHKFKAHSNLQYNKVITHNKNHNKILDLTNNLQVNGKILVIHFDFIILKF